MTVIPYCAYGGSGGLLVCLAGTDCNGGGGHSASPTTSENPTTTTSKYRDGPKSGPVLLSTRQGRQGQAENSRNLGTTF